ncbi:MAG: gliding motility-associated-like protein, partial [Saprospiraceae bacterium]
FLTVTSIDDCVDTDSILVTVDKLRRVFIPNAFTPNFDGINDELVIFGGSEVAQVRSFQIYSRWGELVFEQNNFAPNVISLGWDGTYKGKILDSDVFIYTATVDFIDGVDVFYKGDVSVVR